MAKQVKIESVVKEEVQEVDFLSIIKDKITVTGADSYKIEVGEYMSASTQAMIFNEYSVQGYEAYFSVDNKTVLLLKQ